MKCRSVACIWSDSPPVHKITATAVLHHPSPTLFTAASDGSIIWWSLPTSSSLQGIKPIAMLCGHTAPIPGLGICHPTPVSEYKSAESNSNINNTTSRGSLVSVCTDGVLCVWSRTSGHCRRRRKIPPWAGTPSILKPLPENPRYICVAACSLNENDRETHSRRPYKCTVVIIDSYSLAIVQTVFHGSYVSAGPLKFMGFVLSYKNVEGQSVVLVDSFGNVQCLPIIKDSELKEKDVVGLQKDSSRLEMDIVVDELKEKGSLVSFACSGQVLAFVYETSCVFRLVDDGSVIGDISFLNDRLCAEGGSCIAGGTFLEDEHKKTVEPEESEFSFIEEFVVWNNRGLAVLYKISYSSGSFESEALCLIPGVLHPPDVRLLVYFVQMNNFILRVESMCFSDKEPLLWKPHVTSWMLPQGNEVCQKCEIFAQGNLFDAWTANSTTLDKYGIETPCAGKVNDMLLSNHTRGFHEKGKIVSSSMVISENYHAPLAVIYGFYNGDIEVMRFDVFFQQLSASYGSPLGEETSHASKYYLSGHTDAVLCLASHQLVNVNEDRNFNHVLLSGSMDCTIRLWDLDSGNPITVLHHHVAPVRQIIMPPSHTQRPWSDCFLSVGEDLCVSLASLDTLQVERMFPGHPHYPGKVIWDSARGYIACLCANSGSSDALDVLYIWDVKTGARERVLRGAAAHSMFDHFCDGLRGRFPSGNVINANTSASSLLLSVMDETKTPKYNTKYSGKGTSSSVVSAITNVAEHNAFHAHPTGGTAAELVPSTMSVMQRDHYPIRGSCPFPGIATLSFDLTSLMSICQKHEPFGHGRINQGKADAREVGVETPTDDALKREDVHLDEQEFRMSPRHAITDNNNNLNQVPANSSEDYDWFRSIEGCLLLFSLSFLHLWSVDHELDMLLVSEMKLRKPEFFNVGSGLLGDRGSLTLTFPWPTATLELWKSSSEYSAIRSLTMVSLAQYIITLSHTCSTASSALGAFYTRNLAEKIQDVKPPLLQLLVSFWQDDLEHVKMAARSLFHCAAWRCIPGPLARQKANDSATLLGYSNGIAKSEQEISGINGEKPNDSEPDRQLETPGYSEAEESEIISWIESFEMQDWISCVGGTNQDAMTAHIIVAAALAVWYPSLVKPSLAMLTVNPLIKLVMAMNEKYSSTAAEILAEGMESTWRSCIASEIPRLIGDIFFQIECVSSASANASAQNPSASHNIRETLVGVLLPSLAMSDIPAFLNVIESQIWSTAFDSPVHAVSLMTLSRVVRGSPRNLAQYLDKVVTFILQTMDPANSMLRKTCSRSSMAALKEVVRVFPMVALNDVSTRLAVGDAIGEIKNAVIRVYDMQSMAKIKVLDASGPPGLPSLLGGAPETAVTTAISALSFSPDGEGLVAFSETGLMIRWWSLGSVWWEKLSRNLTLVQCTKLIFVPPWEGFSPNSSRSSIMASVTRGDGLSTSEENLKAWSEMDRSKFLTHNLDLSYRLEWVGERKVKLTRQGQDLGTFQL